MANCSIQNCGKPHEALGLCQAHYYRLKKHGDPLAGGPPSPRHEASRFYREVVLTYEGDDCLIWPFARNDHGYGVMKHKGRMQRVSRMVCEERHGPPPRPDCDAAHSCGSGDDGCVTKRHLSWKTRAGNMEDQLAHGTRARGQSQGSSKLTDDDVRAIRAMRGHITQRELARQYQVTFQTVNDIQLRKRWGWLD